MRIVVLTSLYPPHVGGAPALVERFVEHLDQAGFELEVLTWGATARQPVLGGREAAFDASSEVPVHRVPADVWDGWPIVRLAVRTLGLVARRRRSSRVDRLLCGAAYPCAVVARIVHTFLRTPYVVYAHGEDVSAIDAGRPSVVRVKRVLLAWSLRGAATVFVNSRATLDRVLAVEPRCAPEILPPSIDPGLFAGPGVDEQASLLRGELGIGDASVLLLVARLTSPRKGHDVVLRALPTIAEAGFRPQFVIVGSGDQTAVRAIAGECGVEAQLSILESASDADLAALMRMADVYVMPSRWDPAVQEGEGFGIVYLEAAAAERPSIAGDVGGAVDAVVDGVTGLLVDATSPDAVAGAVVELLGAPDRAREMGAAGRSRVVSTFANDVVLPRLREAVEAGSRPLTRRSATD